MVRIRMKRMGRRNRPFFRINAIDKRTKRDGKIIEQLGWYDPIAKDPAKQIKLEIERCKYWLSKGAQPSDTMNDIFARLGLIDAEKWKAHRAMRAKAKIAGQEAAKAKEAAAAEAAAKPKEKKPAPAAGEAKAE
ncbi:MAG TPA: 30S ribosomal protein S16 [Phycisphaerales bacterium]|nr:30S ribosomal protein S16 [Phycisphaerales bacterium]